MQEDKWYKIAALNKAKEDVAACILDQKSLYAFGGYINGDVLNDIEHYNITQNKWTLLNVQNNHFIRRLAFCHPISASEILVAGGNVDYNERKESYIFNTANNTMRATGDLPEGLRFTNCQAVIQGSNFYAVSYFPDQQVMNYNKANGKWSVVHKFDL